AGWTVTLEDQNEFKYEGATATLAGKPDIVATKGTLAKVIDGKTGRQRDSDIWQVFTYLFAFPKCRPDIVGGRQIDGEVHYNAGDERVDVPHSDLSDERVAHLVKLIRLVASDTPPAKAPSRHECERCNIGPSDCPERFNPQRQRTTAMATEF